MSITPRHAALIRASNRLTERIEELEARLDAGDESARAEYRETVMALAAVAPLVAPGALGQLLTTKQLAEMMAVSTKTILRRRKAGQLVPVQAGKHALRWRA